MATPEKPARPPARYPKPKSDSEILRDLHQRMVRVETRQGRIMEHLGLDKRGDPLPSKG